MRADVAVWRGDLLVAVVRQGVATVFNAEHVVEHRGHPKHGTRQRKEKPRLLGHTAHAVLLWCGSQGWGYEDTKSVLLRLGVRKRGADIARL
jgi:hypothetical protein